MKPNARGQFDAADRAVARTAVRIQRAVADLLAATDPLTEHVAPQDVVERLVAVLLESNPQALDALNRLTGSAAVQFTTALMDWRDDLAAKR